MPPPSPWPTSESTSKRDLAVRDEEAACDVREPKGGHAMDRCATADRGSTAEDLQRADAARRGREAAGDRALPRSRAYLQAPTKRRLLVQQKPRRRPRHQQREVVESPAEQSVRGRSQQGRRNRSGKGRSGGARAPSLRLFEACLRGARRSGSSASKTGSLFLKAGWHLFRARGPRAHLHTGTRAKYQTSSVLTFIVGWALDGDG